MISFSITPKLLALCFLLTLNTSADDSDLTDSPLAQKDPLNFSPSLSDDGFGSIGNQPVIQNEASLQQLSDRLVETPKPPPLTDSDNFNCAGSPHTRKMLRRSWRRLSKRQQHDFCSVQDHEKLNLESPSEPGADDSPAGQQGKDGIGRPRDSTGEPNEFIPDPMLDLHDSQLYGKPNPSLCPDADRSVPMCSPYDQRLTSPTIFLVPSRFCKCFLPAVVSLGRCPPKLSLGRQHNLKKKTDFGGKLYRLDAYYILTGRPNDWCSEMEGTWEDLWCCGFAYIQPSVGWQLRAVVSKTLALSKSWGGLKQFEIQIFRGAPKRFA